MNKNQQKEIVQDLCTEVINSVCSNIDKGKIPDDWTGVELRQYLVDCFQENIGRMDRSRTRKYKNTLRVNGL